MWLKPKMQKIVCIKFYEFDITLKFKKGVKNLRLRVSKDTKISLTLPFYTTQKLAINFLEQHKEWLKSTHKKIAKNLLKDDEILYLGKLYKLEFKENITGVNICEAKILAPNQKSLEKFQKIKAKELFSDIMAKFLPLINKNVNRLSIRKMQTRWGSCNCKKGYINLNLNLLEKPVNLIEYVILHELTHLIYPHHQKSFYDFIQRVMPDFREREKMLNSMPPNLTA